MLREAITDADEGVFEDERAELWFGPSQLCLEVEAHTSFSLEDDIEAVRSSSLPQELRFLELDGDARFLLLEALA